MSVSYTHLDVYKRQDPDSVGVLGHIEVQDLTPVVADQEKAIQNTKRERRDCEEVHRSNCLAMIPEERQAIASRDLGLSGLAEPIARHSSPRDRSPA